MPTIEKILWGMLLVQTLSFPMYFLFGFNLIWRAVFLSIPGFGTVLHAVWTLRSVRGPLFLLIASAIGFLFEYLGLNYGVVFGGFYHYRPDPIAFLGVPLIVLAFWAIFIYTGYCIVTSFLYWLNIPKPSVRKNNFLFLVFLVILDGLIVVTIDLFMDPIMVREGRWTWITDGEYFGVPLGNFAGWFAVSIISSGIFRTLEYFYPSKASRISKSVYFIPLVGYFQLYLSFLISSVQYRMYLLSLIGTLAMMPVVLINSFLFWKFIRSVAKNRLN